jgi:hypothetical protein
MAVPFFDIHPSPRLKFSTLGPDSATRIGKIAWSDIGDFLDEQIPTIPATGASAATVPAPFPGYPQLRVSSIAIEPFSENITDQATSSSTYLTLPNYEYAKVTVEYRTPDSDEIPDLTSPFNAGDPVPLLRHSWNPRTELVVADGYTFKWDDDTSTAEENRVIGDTPVAMPVPVIDHAITWPQVISPPFENIRQTLGKINNAALSFQTGTILKHTLLFVGAHLDREVLSDGTRAWTVTYRFHERRVLGEDGEQGGWNYFWRKTPPSKAGWWPLKKHNGDPIFKDADFLQLFTTTS